MSRCIPGCKSADLVVLIALVKPLGAYMALVFADTPNRVTRWAAASRS